MDVSSSRSPPRSGFPSTPRHPSSAGHTRHPTKRLPATLRAGPGSFVAADARLEGTIILGEGCVLHPRCTVIAAPGATVVFENGCVLEEMGEVYFGGPGTATVGAGTVVMVGAVVHLVPESDGGNGGGKSVGEWCTFQPRCRCVDVRVGDQCTVGAGTAVGPSNTMFTKSHEAEGDAENMSQDRRLQTPRMPDRTVIYGAASAARTWDGSGAAQEQDVRVNATAFLREILPKFNKAREEAPGVVGQR